MCYLNLGADYPENNSNTEIHILDLKEDTEDEQEEFEQIEKFAHYFHLI